MNWAKWIPGNKVLAGGLAAVVTFFIVQAASLAGLDIPVDLQGYITTGITLAVAYLVPPADRDVIRNLNDKIIAKAASDPDSDVSERTTIVPQGSVVVPTSQVKGS